ncbi:hypothetical protein [Nostoc sp. CMAA1605]|uniref:hypothetical protein n=1 Tax=Nostoc sp. CMAA1605 TaxID=2055159 RepID=UPI001F38333E|nr:hypothetical protein [Nostoc sp. CMAA1605]
MGNWAWGMGETKKVSKVKKVNKDIEKGINFRLNLYGFFWKFCNSFTSNAMLKKKLKVK